MLMRLRVLIAFVVLSIPAVSGRVDSSPQDVGEKFVRQLPLTDTATIKFEAKVFLEPDVRSEVLTTVPVNSDVQIVGAPERENFRVPAVFVEIVYEGHRGFVTDAHLDKTDRLMPTLQYLRGEHKLLHRTVESGRAAEVQRTLRSAPGVVNYPDDYGWTALMFASRAGYLEIVQLLLRHDANPNDSNNENETSLLLAAKHGHTNVVAELVALDDIDIDAKDNGDRSAYTWAVDANLTDIVDVLENAGAAPIEPEGELPPYVVAGGITAPKLTGGPVFDARSPSESVTSFHHGRGGLNSRAPDLSPIYNLDKMRERSEWLTSWDNPFVVVEVIVHRDGTCSFVRFIAKPYESDKLDKRFVDAVGKHDFEPAMLRGEPVSSLWFLEFDSPP